MKKREIIFKDIKEYYNNYIKNKKRNNIPISGKKFNHKEIINIVDSALDCWWTEGKYCDIFSNKLKRFLKIKHISLVNSGSSANLIALSALRSHKLKDKRLKKGDEVITTATGFPTTINPIIQNNLVPVFCDIDIKTHNIKIDNLEKALTKKTKAVFLAHTLGNPFNVEKVKKFCDNNRLWLIEDCCDALGAKYNNKYVSSFGDISTLSFYPAHHITTGEGGAVLTNNDLLYKIINSIRDWGRDCWCRTGEDNTCKKRFSMKYGNLPLGYDHKYVYSELGYNLKMTDMQAAIGVAQMDKLKQFIKSRGKNYNYLKSKLNKFNDYFIFSSLEKKANPSWFGFIITLKNNCNFTRETLIKYLNSQKIGTRVIFGGNIVKQPYFTNNNFKYKTIGNLKNSNFSMKNSFWIGVSPLININDINFIEKTLKKFIEKNENNKNNKA